ncbi:MAG TPA: peptidoglycan DD-metalloendopeptidase family protein [Oscillatoriaceae cyanobacterium]
MKRSFSLLLVFAVTLVGSSSAADARRAARHYVSSLSIQQRQLHARQYALSQQLSQASARARMLKQKEVHAVGQLTDLQQKLQETSTQLQDSQFRLQRAQVKLTIAERDLMQARAQFRQEQQDSAERLRAIYKDKAQNEWEALLTSPDMTTFLTRYQFFKRITEHDSDMLENLNRTAHVIHEQQRQYAQQRQSVAQLTEEIGDKKLQLAQMTTSQAQLVTQIKSQRQAAESAVEQLQADNQQIENMIQRIVAQERAQSRTPGWVKPLQGTGQFNWPLAGFITSPFGYRFHPILHRNIMHAGMDIAAPAGTPIHAADSGVVLYSGWYGGYGQVVIINHGHGLTSLYGHQSKLGCVTGQRVVKGQVIGYVGSTGLSTGPHCHFEIRQNGVPVNPMNYVHGGLAQGKQSGEE